MEKSKRTPEYVLKEMFQVGYSNASITVMLIVYIDKHTYIFIGTIQTI